MEQAFRFCCSCVRMTLIKNDCCYFCKGKFLVTSYKDDLKIRERYNVKAHESIS